MSFEGQINELFLCRSIDESTWEYYENILLENNRYGTFVIEYDNRPNNKTVCHILRRNDAGNISRHTILIHSEYLENYNIFSQD